jgi:hypothetical protein
MGQMLESLEKYQSKQHDPTFIDKQNEIPTQNGGPKPSPTTNIDNNSCVCQCGVILLQGVLLTLLERLRLNGITN